ncbi:MAG: hypothetical protein ACREAC_22255 [Blastocatellia bacterium]
MNRRRYLTIGALGCIASLTGLLAARSFRSPASSGPTSNHHPSNSTESSNKAAAELPRLMLWAWERPEDLSFIDTDRIGVAYLAGTIRVDGSRVVVLPRLQPLKVPDDTQLAAVVRLEAGRNASLVDSQKEEIASQVCRLALAHKVRAVQIDFDALKSQRSFYEALLRLVRSKLPDGVALTITALASWCIYDDWIDRLPVDDAIPMVFRMGADRLQVLSRLESGGDFRSSIARHSIGIAVDETPERLPQGRRVYAFNPKRWSPHSVDETLREVARWQ